MKQRLEKLTLIILKNKIIYYIIILLINILSIPIIIFLYVIYPFKHLKLFHLYNESRIGHLAANTDILIRRIKKKRENINNYIGFSSSYVANKSLLKLFRREIKIIVFPQYLDIIIRCFFRKECIFAKTIFFIELTCNSNEYEEFSLPSNLKFTKKEEEKGNKLLYDKIKLKKLFVCFHSRDKSYLNKVSILDFSSHNYRDWNIEDSYDAMNYLVKNNIYVVRMGSVVEKKLNIKNKKIIDYATKYRTDFGDIYLSAKCKFFLDAASGLSQVAQIFNVPIIWVNSLPIQSSPPWNKRDLFIPKKLYLIKEKRFLSIKEIFKLKLENALYSQDYINAGVKCVNNTPQEILDITIEMNERLDGTWKTKKEDEELQKRYKSLFGPNTHCHGFPSRIGAKFLRENKWLLD
jgi:putative glycosyltransferase (TIGR04372 family)